MHDNSRSLDLDYIMNLREWVISGIPNPLSRDNLRRICRECENGISWQEFRRLIEGRIGERVESRIAIQIFNRREELADDGGSA